DTPSIAVIDLETGMTAASVPLSHAPRALDFAPGGKVYFTVTGVDGLEVLDPTTNQVAGAPIATGGDLEYVDVDQGKVVASVPTGKAPHWIGLTGVGSRAYVTNESDSTVSVV